MATSHSNFALLDLALVLFLYFTKWDADDPVYISMQILQISSESWLLLCSAYVLAFLDVSPWPYPYLLDVLVVLPHHSTFRVERDIIARAEMAAPPTNDIVTRLQMLATPRGGHSSEQHPMSAGPHPGISSSTIDAAM